MLADSLKEELDSLKSDIHLIKHFWETTEQEASFEKLQTLTQDENFWLSPEQTTVLKNLQHFKNRHEQYHHLITTYSELYELIDLFENNEQDLTKIKSDIGSFKKKLIDFKISLLLNEQQDNAACFLSINPGAGGTEAQDWAHMLLRMYIMFCEHNKLTAHLIDYQSGEEAGIKSATLFVKSKNAYGLLKSEHGIHRLIRISPFDANKRRHTSFAGVSVIPEVPDVGDIILNPADLRIDTYRASGAGGQHVNKTESAVRITHIPTGMVTQCQNERSQGQNKENALAMLRAKLAQKARDEQKEKMQAAIEKKEMGFGSQIRSYFLHPEKRIKDHRTDYESFQPEKVLSGDLTDFIEQYLVWYAHRTFL